MSDLTDVPADDRGLLLGDGLFETLLADCGKLTRFDEHAARLSRGCAVLGLPDSGREALFQAASAAVARAGLAEARAAVRLTWTAGGGGRGLDRPLTLAPRLIGAASPAPASTAPLTVVTSSVRRNEGSPASRLKTLAYLDNVLARREARAAGADEALMLNGRGCQVACAAAANLFWILDGRLFTPALSCGVLDGVVRGLVLRSAADLGAPVEEVEAGSDVLAHCTAMVLTNSLIGVRAVASLDGRRLRKRWHLMSPGRRSRALRL